VFLIHERSDRERRPVRERVLIIYRIELLQGKHDAVHISTATTQTPCSFAPLCILGN